MNTDLSTLTYAGGNERLMRVVVRRLFPILRKLSTDEVMYSISESNFTCYVSTVPDAMSSITVSNEADTEAFTLVKRSNEPTVIQLTSQSEILRYEEMLAGMSLFQKLIWSFQISLLMVAARRVVKK